MLSRRAAVSREELADATLLVTRAPGNQDLAANASARTTVRASRTNKERRRTDDAPGRGMSEAYNLVVKPR